MAARPAESKNKTRLVVGRLLLLVGAALALYIVVPQIGGLRGTGAVLKSAHVALLGDAVLLLLLASLLPTASYLLLALHPLRFTPTFLVQVAGGLVGKLLPAGLGVLGLNALYLTKNRHTSAEATAVVGAHNIIAFGCFTILTIVVAAAAGQAVTWPHARPLYVLLAVSALAIALVALLVFWKKKLAQWLRELTRGLKRYARQPWKVILAIVPNALLPLTFSLLLYCVALAVGAHITFVQAIAAFIAGQSLGSVTPTPGGVIGAETGVTAALVGFGLPASFALSVALLYRLITYWLPLLLGTVSFAIVRRRYL